MIKDKNNIIKECTETEELTVSKTDIIEPEQLHQSELIQELQAYLFEISLENIQITIQYIINSIFVMNTERIEQLARNIFFAARFRSMKIELLSDLISELVLNSTKKPLLRKLPQILMNLFFTKAFHDEYSYKETWRFFFLYQLLKRKIYLEKDIISEIRKFYSNYSISKNEDQVGLFKIMCAWFAPEIEQQAPDLFAFFTTHSIFTEEEQSEKNTENPNNITEGNNTENNNIMNQNFTNSNNNVKNNFDNQQNRHDIDDDNDVLENKDNIAYRSDIISDDNDKNTDIDKNEINNNQNIKNRKPHNDLMNNKNINYDDDFKVNYNYNNTNISNNDENDHSEGEEDNQEFFQNVANNQDNNDNLQYQPENAFDIETESESEPQLFIFQGNGENETRVFDVLASQGYTLDVLKANNWNFYHQCRESGYTIDPLVQCLLNDDDDELQRLSSEPDFDIETMIEPSLFSRSTILQDSTSPICFAAAVGSVKCFRFLLLNNANLEYETWNEHPTTISSFAVSGGSNEIVRLLNQKGKSFNEAIFVAVQYHRTDIFNWLFQLLNVDIEIKNIRYGTLLHRAAKSNNVELSLFCMEHRCDVNKPVVNSFNNIIFFYMIFLLTIGHPL